jgi:hypothetical protein
MDAPSGAALSKKPSRRSRISRMNMAKQQSQIASWKARQAEQFVVVVLRIRSVSGGYQELLTSNY